MLTVMSDLKPTPHTVRLAHTEKSFHVDAHETVLAASKRAGLALPYSCLSGRCGSCAARVLNGQWRYQQQPTALTASEHRDHALLCQAYAVTDLELALADLEIVAKQRVQQVPACLREKRLIAPEVLALQLDPIETLVKPTHLAGQYLEFVLADGKRRPFSIANAPRADQSLELHVRRVAGGGFTQHLFDEAVIGDLFQIDLPHGTFVPRADSDRELLFVAGGTGFAPIKALLEHFAEKSPQRSAHLYWGVRVASDFYLTNEIQSFQKQMPALRYTGVLSEQANSETRYGNLHDIVLQDYSNLSQVDVYMSGPPAMISASRSAFLNAGLPEHRLYYDSFEFAPDVLAKMIHARREQALLV
jgi:CDP-4-dehydro-6-deoxyglucose reductase, E3